MTAPIPPHCAQCGQVTDALASLADRAFCPNCLAGAIRGMVAIPDLERRMWLFELHGQLVIGRELCEELRAEIRQNYARRFQQEILAARDPPPKRGEEEPIGVTVTLSIYMRDRAQALADEAGVSLSTWIRSAVSLAFRSTAAPKGEGA